VAASRLQLVSHAALVRVPWSIFPTTSRVNMVSTYN